MRFHRIGRAAAHTAYGWIVKRLTQIGGVGIRTAGLPRAILHAASYYGSYRVAVRKAFEILLKEGPAGIARRLKLLAYKPGQPYLSSLQHLSYDLAGIKTYLPKVSVIVPNFNHGSYLRQRLQSVYGQTYKNFEVILLDDSSTDESVV